MKLSVTEPRVYALDSPHSYYGDFYMATARPRDGAGANERLTRYAREVAHEIERRSPEGLRAERIIRNYTRVDDPDEHERRFRAHLAELRASVTAEQRATTTGGGATASAAGGGAAAFVTPYFLDKWATYRGIHRTFANQCMRLPLPAFGMEVYVPTFSSASGVAQKAEGAAVTETDPSAALQGAAVAEITGQVTLSMAAHDRAWAGGGTFDALVHAQLRQQLDQQIDVYALTQAIASAGTTTNNVTWTANSIAPFLTDLASGREGLTDTAGVRLWPTRLISTSDFFSYVSHLAATSGQAAIVTSQYVPGLPLDGDRDDPNERDAWSRFTGVVMPGALPWFLDDNIPTAGGTANNTQVIVSATQESLILLEDPNPVLSVFEQSGVAGNLQVILNAREYAALITRHASGTQVITGTAYPSTNK